MQTLNDFLKKKDITQELQSIFCHIALAAKKISASICTSDMEKRLAQNCTGDTQSKLDTAADKIIATELIRAKFVFQCASEEQEKSQFCNKNGTYFVAYDPYDGGTVGDCNITFGSIFGIWRKKDIISARAKDGLVAACYILYGPRVTFTLAIAKKGVHTFELRNDGQFLLTKENQKVAKNAKHFAPGNLKACNNNPQYKKVVDYWIASGKRLRYTGALVTDINHIICKGDGIFCYPKDREHPSGRLRLLYEGAPLAFLLLEAGGVGYTQDNKKILDIAVKNYHQRTTLFMGSRDEVQRVLKMMKS